MEALITACILAWLFMRGVEAVWKEWEHTRDRHRASLARSHPEWSPGRINRNARWRARGHWWHEITNRFPSFRQAWAEHSLLAKTERAEAKADGESRLAGLRERLRAAQERLEEARKPAPASPEAEAAPDAEPVAEPPHPEPAELPAAGDPEPEAEDSTPAAPEPWTADPAPAGWDSAPEPDGGYSDWLRPGDELCEGCGGTGRDPSGTGACPACRGWGSAPPDPKSPRASDSAVCASCGRRGNAIDPVLATPSGNTHLSHAEKQQAAYTAALDQMRARQAATEEPSTTTEGTDEVTTAENADTPFEGLQNVLKTQEQQQRAVAQHAQDELIAYAITHGFDRDPAVMAQIQGVHDAAEAAATSAANAHRTLAANHTEGAEYHGTGRDAHASAFRPS